MAIETIKKIHILGYQGIEKEVIGLLQDLGVVEISELLPESGEKNDDFSSPGIAENRELAGKLDKLEYLIELLGKFIPRHDFLEGQGKKIIRITKKELRDIVDNFDLGKNYADCKILERELEEIKIKKNKLEHEKHLITPWLSLETKLNRFVSTKGVRINLGHIPLNQFNNFQKEIFVFGEEISVYEISADKNSQYLVLLYLQESAPAVEEILRRVEFVHFYHPLVDLSPREIIIRIEQELVKVNKEEERMQQLFSGYSVQQPKLKVLYDYYSNLQAKEKIRQFFSRTKESFCLTGWIPAKESERIRKILSDKFAYLEIIFTDPEEKDRVPIVLHNRKVVQPFEVITDLYGRPLYRGIDPTPYLSIFFAVFFGLCLTDAGYGLVVMLLSGLALLRYSARMGQTSKNFFRLFFLGGVATVFLGAMVGGWFGITVKWKLFDPLEDLLVFFAIALGLGIVHIFTGLSIKMWQNIKSGDWLAAYSDQMLWMLTVAALLVYGLAKGKIFPPTWEMPAKILSLGAALGIIFFQGRRADKNLSQITGIKLKIYSWLWLFFNLGMTAYLLGLVLPVSKYLTILSFFLIILLGYRNWKGILGRIGLGLYSLYGISSFLGDTLSYSRLVALGLTTGIVGMVINKMAGIAYPAPYVGFILALIILIIGHAFNIVINLLGAFVHSCRLQYVEFFTKFYEAGGKSFRPFVREGKYTLVTD